MIDRATKTLASLMYVVGVLAPLTLLVLGAEGCCDRKDKVYPAGTVQAFKVIPDAEENEVSMRVRAGGKVYHLDKVLEGTTEGRHANVYKAHSDCSLNVLLCTEVDDVKECSPVRKIWKVKAENPSNEGLGIPK